MSAKYGSLLEQLAEQMNVAPDAEIVGGIVFEDFTEMLTNGIPLPDILIPNVLYDGPHLHLVSGDPGDGKTSWVMKLSWEAMLRDKHVIWLDYEGGMAPTLRRLVDVGVPTPLLLDRFHYASFPEHAEKHLVAVHERWPDALVVIDSLSKALAYAGVSENANDEVTKWAVPVVKTCKQNDMPLVIIDHVAKAGAGSKYSRGAGAKLADVDVHWGVEKTENFSRNKAGSITCNQLKDRPGHFDFATWWHVGDGMGNLTITPGNGPIITNEEGTDAPDI